LRLAIAYIALLREVLVSKYDPLTYVEKCLKGEIKSERAAEWNTSGKNSNFLIFDISLCEEIVNFQSFYLCTDLTARLSWINWENLGVNANKRGMLSSISMCSDNLN
jgi:hypothetical protein